jgi:hypothetical protein
MYIHAQQACTASMYSKHVHQHAASVCSEPASLILLVACDENKRLRLLTGACSMVVMLQQPVAALCGDARPTVGCRCMC